MQWARFGDEFVWHKYALDREILKLFERIIVAETLASTFNNIGKLNSYDSGNLLMA